MPNTLQDFFAVATQKAATDLLTAVLRIPEDKRNWSPDEKARTALDQIAECTLLNGYSTDLILTQKWSMNDFDVYYREKSELVAQDWMTLSALLQENTNRVIAAIQTVSDDMLSIEIEMPWEKRTMAETVAYPYWNMSYHEGQINYIASILGCL